MRQINNDSWDKELTICLTLKELQCIYDCCGMSNYRNLEDNWVQKHKNTKKITSPYTAEFLDGVYDNLEELIEENGGIAN